MVQETLPYPSRFRIAASLGKAARPLGKALPGELAAMLDLLPNHMPAGKPYPEIVPAEGKRRARVALLIGCVQQALDPEINWATIRVLTLNGVEVVIPTGQGCCGAILMHAGDMERARALACKNVAAFPKDVDAIITNAAGCSSGMKDYGFLFAGSSHQAEADQFSARVLDISVFLAELGLVR
jgi:glycolate oxidase iron-sulfur subunit